MSAREGGNTHHRPPRPYRCFLIRCWRADDTQTGEESYWRFIVQEAGIGGLRHSFLRLSDVEMYLQTALKFDGEGSAEQQDS